MFEYIFPIFCFGVLITAIVIKGLLTAAEMNRSQYLTEAAPSQQEDVTSAIFTALSAPYETGKPDFLHRPEPETRPR